MLMPPFNLHHPNTVEEACELASSFIGNEESFDWVAGGTDILPNYKWHINVKKHVISLAKIAGLDTISMHEIGAMARLGALTTSDSVHPLIASAASKIASSLVRNNATVGGNICLDTRCFWINQSEDWRRSIDWCHKEDCGTGSDCRVIPNQNTLCVATYQGDLAPSLIVLEGTIHIIGPHGPREVPAEAFFQLDGITRNILEEGEFVLKVTFPQALKIELAHTRNSVFESRGIFQRPVLLPPGFVEIHHRYALHQQPWNRFLVRIKQKSMLR